MVLQMKFARQKKDSRLKYTDGFLGRRYIVFTDGQ
jgi:hypothetical protein